MRWKRNLSTWLCLTLFLSSTVLFAENATPNVLENSNILKVSLGAQPPIDPLFLTSMAEYDLSLILNRTWFNYDNNRQATPGLIKNWKFEEASGSYIFNVGNHKWSDGSSLLAVHFIENLNRIAKSKTHYGKALKALINIKTAKVLSEDQFSFQTISKKPSEALFAQLGSVFLSLIHPDDLDKNGIRLIQNAKTIGPYKIKSIQDKETIYDINPFFKSSNPNAPTEILVKLKDQTFNLDAFLDKKTWSNYFQTSSILPKATASKITSSKFPIWTRGFDRVALMKPLGKGVKLQQQKDILKLIGFEMQQITDFKHPLRVAIAKSLQPLGYPLFKEIQYKKPKAAPKQTVITILSYEMSALEFYKDWFKKLEPILNVTFKWNVLSADDFLKTDWSKTGSDFALFSFGVADPEATTWLSLVFQSKFISYDKTEKDRFEKIMKILDPEKQASQYRALLHDMGKAGSYLPLFHGATLSIGTPGMDFSLAGALDETVDYSKIQFIK